jgi:hypothetical protein
MLPDTTIMKMLSRLTRKDRHALIIYFGVVGLFVVVFAAGILIACVIPRSTLILVRPTSGKP